MKKIWNWILAQLAKISRDKLYHFLAGLIISAFFCITLGMKACIVPAIFAGFIKEFVDQWRYSGWDWIDFAYTVAGGLVIQFFVLINL